MEDRRLLSTSPVETLYRAPVLAAAEADASQPSITTTDPAPGATGVRRDAFVAAYVSLPNVGHGVDTATLTSSTVKLYKTSDTTKTSIAGNRNTSGGGDVITFTPSSLLSSSTSYTFEVTSGVKDTSGAAFGAYKMTFTTGTAGAPDPASIGFDKVSLSNATGRRFTGITIGPDNRLYAATVSGEILRWNINSDGTLSSTTTINTVKNGNGGRNRIITGIHFDPTSTASNLILWVTHGDGVEENAPDWTSKISRLTGSSLGTYQDYVTGLPRSVRDHLVNQIDFDSQNRMYVSQGSMTAMGAPDNAWGQRAEHLLSAAILRVDFNAIATRIANGQGPLNVKTESGGTYNPYATGAAVTLYATGVRNAYDLLWHSNGNLYAPSNGSAPGGNTPAGGGAVALNNVQQVQPDFFFKIRKDKYYGHPNPKRSEYVMNGGDPTSGTDKYEVSAYPSGTQPDSDWDPAIYSFGANRSPNGIIEYKSGAFGGALQGSMLVVRYSGGDDILVLTPDSGGNLPSGNVKSGISGLTGFVDPLDLTEHVGPGNIYVIEHGAEKITLLRPKGTVGSTPSSPVRDPNVLYFNEPVGGAASSARSITIRNGGSSSLTITGISLTGSNPSLFGITSKPSTPFTLAAGATTTISVNFNPPSGTSLGVKTATLRLTTSSSSTPTIDRALRGIATAGLEGANEPSLQRLFDLFQLPINAGDANPSDSNMPLPLASGNNAVNIQRFVKAGSGSVTIEPLAVFASASTPTIRFGYYNISSGASTEVTTTNSSQSVNPAQTSGSLSFDPGSSTFGLYTNAPAFGTRKAYSEDSKNTWEPISANRKKMLLFPLKDKSGNTVPNAYVMAWEEVTGSYDFQDYVAVIRNVRDANVSTPPPPADGGAINSLSLVNADTDQTIRAFENNASINYATDGPRLTVKANTSGTIGSVRWQIDGSNVRTENYAPWAIGGDTNNGTDLSAYNFPLGTHTLRVTAYSGSSASGTVLGDMTLTFTVSDSGPPPTPPVGEAGTITSLSLVNADSDQTLRAFENNATINYATDGPRLTVKANTAGTIGSVRWQVDGSNVRTENFAPWAIGGDQNNGADLLPYNFPLGTHTLRITAFSAANASGNVLKDMTLTFTVTNSAPAPGATINGLVLVNADNDQAIGAFENNTSIDYSLLPANLTVRADTTGSVGSVRWQINGTEFVRTENFAPWALGGDQNGSDLLPYDFRNGTHTMKVTAFSGAGGTGTVLRVIDLIFNVGNA